MTQLAFEVHLFGTSHLLQQITSNSVMGSCSSGLLEGRERFARELEQTIAAYPEISLIAEETSQEYWPTICQSLAQKGQRGYLALEPCTTLWNESGFVEMDSQVNRELSARREMEMFTICQQYLGHVSNSAGLLVVCGLLHVPGLRSLFRASQFRVCTASTILSKGWCTEEHAGAPLDYLRRELPNLNPDWSTLL